MSAAINIRPNTFEEVVIGTQTWMKYNYDFGGSYPNNDIDNISTYGKLYTWAEACAIDYPGWHLPTVTEVGVLIDYCGENLIAGGNLKESGTAHWTTPNTDADNSSGFTALGAGSSYLGEVSYFNLRARFWTSTEQTGSSAYLLETYYNNATAYYSGVNKDIEASVRLIKD